MSFKIPSFLSKKFSQASTKEQKDELVQKYKNWYHNELTQELLEHLEATIQNLQEEEENKVDFLTLFQSKYSSAHYKGQKKSLRKIVKQLTYK